MKHPWNEYRARFVLDREWASVTEMQKALEKEAPGRGIKAPSLKLISNKAAKDGWIDSRKKVENEAFEEAKEHVKAKLARRLIKDADRLLNLQELSQAMLGLGASHIVRMHNAEKQGTPQVTNVYEAESLIRTSALLDRLAADRLQRLVDPKRAILETEGMGGDDAGGEGVQRGVVFMPEKLEPAEWDAGRRLNLGSGAQDPEAPKKPEDDEEPKP